MLGIEWAEANGIEVARFPADWDTHGRAAGPIRNQQMLDEANPTWWLHSPAGEVPRTWLGAPRRPASNSFCCKDGAAPETRGLFQSTAGSLSPK